MKLDKNVAANTLSKIQNLAMDLADDLQRDDASHWTVIAWRCRVGQLQRKVERTETWESVPGLVHSLIAWQLDASTGINPMPDPGPLHVQYVPEGGVDGTGHF